MRCNAQSRTHAGGPASRLHDLDQGTEPLSRRKSNHASAAGSRSVKACTASVWARCPDSHREFRDNLAVGSADEFERNLKVRCIEYLRKCASFVELQRARAD